MAEALDSSLLRDYLRSGSQAAFSELVARHADWVYSMAVRLVRDRPLAEDVTQAVFLALSQNGNRIRSISVRAWLFKATRYVAANALRAESRRAKHERRAALMKNPVQETAAPQEWEGIAAQLDEFISRLRKSEREAVLLRFYQSKSFSPVGGELGVSEEAARKRLARAIEKLRDSFRTAGVSPAPQMFVATLEANTSHAAPMALRASCASLSGSSAAHSFAQGVTQMIMRTKLATAAVVVLALGLMASSLAVVLRAQSPAGAANPAAPPAVAATQPATDGGEEAIPGLTGAEQMQMESWWADLEGNEPECSRALLHFAATPQKTVAFLQTKMLPLSITPERVKGLIVQLSSPDEKIWRPAFDELSYFDPRLAIDLQTLMDTVKSTPTRQRLVAILSGRPPELLATRTIELRKFGTPDMPQYNFVVKTPGGGTGSFWAEPNIARLGMGPQVGKESWTRAVRGIVLLEQIGTPDAIAVLNQMASGDPDALPTKTAKEALANMH